MPDLIGNHGTWDDDCSDVGELLGLLTAGRPDWHADAACREAPVTVTWFPELGQQARPAKAVCERCLVRSECASWAAGQDPDLAGIWGGLSDRERRKNRRTAA